ncbi:MAG TPA: 4-hydroxy-tetrahydrodipicolinate synthase [Syntrophaceticus sp.]|uniref:4-hydroxy-tetrahydrodipicolinate synthase n=1 Tax=Syntrophaceticus schinkii TaxID=499207 RepID=A0A0B7MI63_9FIRM|nr:4-hydroxy-tetrahydrodipicolinate synthase [Syntrophaceticus schinkii]MDD4260835.1 4-hydroxy-tetrahydrodipicolinate synthase [Syntrophaceticus schinkii]MDD4675233.1 4-hydroxy-tetrahydrodipicolinate synthase [Syntrophaceticus schinkii]CEO87322.1 dihydrodipicolinate synthase [Syntrophaceticus schinkii]HHY31044.1 4-hydroxy-tetrahydrodipicolinate synthase [Syntrophaceticus sp.]
MKGFGRILTAMVTPMKENGEVNYEEAGKLACHLVETGSEGVVVSGTTGESPVLTVEEKCQLFKVVREAVTGKAAVIAGTGSYNTADSIELTKQAEKIGCDGIMLVTPYYNKPSQEGLYRHFKAVASQTGLPVILYNVPGRTALNMLPETVARLAAIENIIAVKEASGSLDQVAEIKRMTPGDFLVYSGDDSMTLPILSVGGYGVISVASHLAGKMIQEMVTSFVTGKVKTARELHLKLFPLYKVLFITTNPVPVKAAVEFIGIKAGAPRLPLVRATEQEVNAIKQVMGELGLLLP